MQPAASSPCNLHPSLFFGPDQTFTTITAYEDTILYFAAQPLIFKHAGFQDDDGQAFKGRKFVQMQALPNGRVMLLEELNGGQHQAHIVAVQPVTFQQALNKKKRAAPDNEQAAKRVKFVESFDEEDDASSDSASSDSASNDEEDNQLEFMYTNEMGRHYDHKRKIVKSVRFPICLYPSVYQVLMFKTPKTEADAIQAAEQYLSEPMDEAYYNRIKDDLNPSLFDSWATAKASLQYRGDVFDAAVCLEYAVRDSKGQLVLWCGN